MDKIKHPTAIDLFCGCGGISCGLEMSSFKVLAGLDIEPAYLQTFQANFPQAQSLSYDLSTVSPEDILTKVGLAAGELTVLAGGPPCQGFSKNVPRRNRYMEDPRNQLVSAFLRVAAYAKPRFVLMENVAEMRAGFEGAYTSLLLEVLGTGLGYSVSHCVLNAPDYGVPQRRRRTFFLASRDMETIAFPAPTHKPAPETPGLFDERHHVSVWEAISDLPDLEHGQGDDPCDYASDPQNDFQRWARQGNHQLRNHVARRLRPVQYERLSSLEPGQGAKDLPEHLRPQGGYSGAYGRLTKTMVAPTITRWVFHPGSGRFGHPIRPRVITNREAARLQGFPDVFNFVGTYIQQSHQIGNAVPPLLIEKISRMMLR